MVITITVGTVTNTITLPDATLINDPEALYEAGRVVLRSTMLQASQGASDAPNQVPEQ